MAGDDGADDGGGDDDQKQRAPRGGDLLADGLERVHAQPPAAVALGEVDAQVALLGQLVPELARRLVRLDDPPRVCLAANRSADSANGRADLALLIRLDEGQRDHLFVRYRHC
jgi:hypothetical protein